MDISKYFLPVGLSYIVLLFNDNSFTRALFKNLSIVSIFGSWLFEWYAMYEYVLTNENAGQLQETGFIKWISIFLGVTIFAQMIPQVVLIPQIVEYVNEKHDDSLAWNGIF